MSSARAAAVPRPSLVERRMTKFLREPPSARLAASVIVTATALVVVAGGVLIRLLDHHEYPNIWVSLWLSVQTVTTVGYGDVTPKNTAGRLVASLVMLEGIAVVAVITAAITSTFVARAQREREQADQKAGDTEEQHLNARFNDLAERLDRLETMLSKLGKA